MPRPVYVVSAPSSFLTGPTVYTTPAQAVRMAFQAARDGASVTIGRDGSANLRPTAHNEATVTAALREGSVIVIHANDSHTLPTYIHATEPRTF